MTYTSNKLLRKVNKPILPNSTYNGFSIDVSEIQNQGLIILTYVGNSSENYLFLGLLSKDSGEEPVLQNIGNKNTTASITGNTITFVCNGVIYYGDCNILYD